MTMRDALGTGYLLLPLLGGGIFHGLCMKYGWLAVLKHPIDGGYTLRGRPLFGSNKTIRGVVAVGIGTAIVLGIQASLLHGRPIIQAIVRWSSTSDSRGCSGRWRSSSSCTSSSRR